MSARSVHSANPLVRVTSVRCLDADYELELGLSNGQRVVRYLRKYCTGKLAVGLRARLADPKFFRRVRAVEGTLVWSRDVDICPNLLIWGQCPSGRRRKPERWAEV